MIRFYKTPWITRMMYPNLQWKGHAHNCIYLTFDDGPHPIITPWVLDVLEKANAKATFFCVGKNVREYPDLTQLILKAGHSLGNHTFNHLKGWKTTTNQFLSDVEQCDQEMKSLGIETDLFRPPYGRIKRSQIKELKSKRIIMWSHLSWDFDKELNLKTSISQLKNADAGSILAFHDTSKAYGNLKVILPELLSHFTSKGLKFEAII